ncbi:uncharacterized protein LOC135493410 isoform X2 [Lineus longissimus]|uniref:uncharacterized protein LOC135493410 isoform X2 n=1 Tax=Lineus longissimus TaxID=88925 RepID=UPI002B4D6AB7
MKKVSFGCRPLALLQIFDSAVSKLTKDGFVEVIIDIPGLKTKKKGLLGNKRIVDEAHCHLNVTFGDAAVEMSAEITKGLKAGRKFQKTIEIKELIVPSIKAIGNYYEVQDDTVRIYVKK